MRLFDTIKRICELVFNRQKPTWQIKTKLGSNRYLSTVELPYCVNPKHDVHHHVIADTCVMYETRLFAPHEADDEKCWRHTSRQQAEYFHPVMVGIFKEKYGDA